MNPTLLPLAACRRPAHGFALVIVLVILSLLTVIAVGFLSSMSSERATASAFTNRTRAEQAAQAGVDSAIGMLRDYFKAFPDSATVWDTTQNTNPDGSPSEGTTLYLRAMPQANDKESPDPTLGPNATDANLSTGNNPNNVVPVTPANIANNTAGKENRQTFALPLVSGATVKVLADKSKTLPALTADSTSGPGNSINLNARRQIGDKQGWLGTRPDYVYPSNPAGVPLPKPTYVPWVEIYQKDGYASTSTPAPGVPAPQPPVVGRYAFWVEDESFRANVSYAGQGTGAVGSSTRVRRDNPAPVVNGATVAPQLPAITPKDSDLFGVFKYLTTVDSSAGIDPANGATSLSNARQVYPGALFPESRAFGHAGENGTDLTFNLATIGDLRYLTTSQSSALNLSRHGTQRLNLNTVVPQTALPTDAGQAKIVVQEQIDKLFQTMQFHLPNFGQRLYRTTAANLNAFSVPLYSTSPADPTTLTNCDRIYFYKMAANIRDYIDPDPIPTIIDRGGSVRNPGKPMLGFQAAGDLVPDGNNEIWAQGKDSAPFVEECATRFRGSITPDHTHFSLTVDYYIEVWNSSNLDVNGSSLGPHPVIRVANPPAWKADGPGYASIPPSNWSILPDLINDDPAPANASPSDTRYNPAKRDYDIDISGVTFKAGVATVITTDPNYTDYIPAGSEGSKHTFLCDFYPKFPDPGAVGKRIYTGRLPQPPQISFATTYIRMIWGEPTPPGATNNGATGSSDYDTNVILSNDNQLIDGLQGCMPNYNNGSADVTFSYPLNSGPYFMCGSLHGNNGNTNFPGITGDPRSNNEQLVYDHYDKTGNIDQTRYFNETVLQSNLGLPNSGFTQPSNTTLPYVPWPDYYAFPSGPTMTGLNAPYIIANATITSIGQLGDIYDPERPAGTTVTLARGGGRTLKIGQHDDLWDGDVTSASHGWAAWRLTDFFCVSDAMDQPGLININGVARDNGAALRAAVTGLTYQPVTSPTGMATNQPASNLLDTNVYTLPQNVPKGLQSVIDEIKARIATPAGNRYSTGYLSTDNTGSGPFFERGELSELPTFSRTVTPPGGSPPAPLVTGVNMATTLDRGREELFRRLVEMTTTRGSVFTVYALGQSINQSNPSDPKTKRVTGTQQLRVTFKLLPMGSDGKPFNPASTDSPTTFNPAARFTKPDHYDVQVLSASSGNG